MPHSRVADSTIKGFVYQFNKTILEILDQQQKLSMLRELLKMLIYIRLIIPLEQFNANIMNHQRHSV